ncbi:MAG: hypothetical protein NTY91_07615 [Euryarchaeota archaeon]|nr:hypothetical protein [Euryarchaeota archaeon]
MVDVKKTLRKQVNKNRKKFLTISILFILISSAFPLMSLAKIPTRDSHLTIDSKKTNTEPVQSNSYVETTTSVLPWWNTNWHYRKVYNITGVGNISLPMNFTSLLKSLHVMGKTFENSTITIVRYYTNGTMIVINKTWFNESTIFHNITNANGTLSWSVSGTASYGVYFDVKENRGTRSTMNETVNLKPSSSVHYSGVPKQEGWWPIFTEPFETYYPVNETLLIKMYTTALAKNVTANFSLKGHLEFNMSLTTFDNLNWSKNITKKLSKIGDWTISVVGYDDAGYHTPPLIADFYVGKPELVVSGLIAPDVGYVGYNITIVTNIRAFNTSVEHVNITLQIDNVNKSIQEVPKIKKDENKTVQFSWRPLSKGKHTITVRIYYNDSNLSNNRKSKNVTIEEVPDLAVIAITVAPTAVNEGNPVEITASIRNNRGGNATNYEIVLYCEQNQKNQTMNYNQSKNSTTFSLNKNMSKNVTLIWSQTRYGNPGFKGEWAIGIEIRNTTQTPDINDTNNKKALFNVLRVIAAERNPPVLSNLEYLSSIEQGDQLLIGVKATDASGIDTVIISIKTPNKTYKNATMTAEENNRYEYLFTTVQLGRHNFTIKATDLSPNKNQSIITGYFLVTEDQTPPSITYFGVNPSVQLSNHPVEIRCIATDYSGIRSAVVTIRFPDNQVETHTMSIPLADTKYIYTKTYETTGKYVFSITVTDTLENQETTTEKTFWITDTLNDTDNDGMPDDWEERYGLNPYDSNDASQDQDNDGITNLEEYQQGTNPLKKISSSSEFFERLQENLAYLTASLIVLIIIILLAWYGIRRRTQ